MNWVFLFYKPASYLNWSEKLAHNEKVTGSSPVEATKKCGYRITVLLHRPSKSVMSVQFRLSAQNAKVAQLVECDLAKIDVAGSNPVFRSQKWWRL